MPQLPEDIIDRLTQMERRIQALSTAVNTRPAQNEVTDGAFNVRLPNGTSVLQVGKWDEDPEKSEYGVAMRRQTGELAIALYNGSGSDTTRQVLRLYDSYGHEVFSDDIVKGGLARPWLAMLPPQDLASANWPATTSLNNWATIARSYNPVWQPRMRLLMETRASAGATGEVKVIIDGATQFGGVVAAGSQFDVTDAIVADITTRFGTTAKIEIQARVTSASGTVYAKPVLMYGTQS
ncbi:hypothetical protein ABZ572_25930 [Streptomyces sp. NPDC018338]|uniref:hypothetical protein n=1 Tax=Streptomyces sp. NPDC018338 TaxID=3157192 RepID=UPI0033FE94C5